LVRGKLEWTVTPLTRFPTSVQYKREEMRNGNIWGGSQFISFWDDRPQKELSYVRKISTRFENLALRGGRFKSAKKEVSGGELPKIS